MGKVDRSGRMLSYINIDVAGGNPVARLSEYDALARRSAFQRTFEPRGHDDLAGADQYIDAVAGGKEAAGIESGAMAGRVNIGGKGPFELAADEIIATGGVVKSVTMSVGSV